MSMFMDMGIHPSMTISMIDENVVEDICFRNIYFVMNKPKKTVSDLLRMWNSFFESHKADAKYTHNLQSYL